MTVFVCVVLTCMHMFFSIQDLYNSHVMSQNLQWDIETQVHTKFVQTSLSKFMQGPSFENQAVLVYVMKIAVTRAIINLLD